MDSRLRGNNGRGGKGRFPNRPYELLARWAWIGQRWIPAFAGKTEGDASPMTGNVGVGVWEWMNLG